MANILIVEDEEDIRDILKTYLVNEGHAVFEAENIKKMNILIEKGTYNIILLDLMLPDGDSLEEIPFIRSKIPDTGIIIISARGSERDRITGIDTGADDYVSKPFNPREVVSRTRALLKRLNKQERSLFFENLEIQPWDYSVKKFGEKIELTVKEFEILFLLAGEPRKVFSRDEILDKIWFSDEFVTDRVIDVHISSIRNKIGKNYIKTIRNGGYRFIG